MKFHLNPYREVIVASIIFGTGGVFIKYINLPPTSIAFFRFVVPTIVVGIWMRYTQKEFWRRGDRKMLVLLSSLNVIRMYLYFLGFTMTSVGNAVVALYTSPIFAMVFAVWLLGEKMNRVRYMSLILAVLGLIVIGYSKGLSITYGDIIGISAIVSSAFIQGYVTVLMKTSLRTYDKVSLIFYQCVIGAIVFLPFALFYYPIPTFTQMQLASVYAFLIGVVGFVLYFSALKQMDATVVSILTYLEMVGGIIFARLLLGEYISMSLIIGAILIIFGGVVLGLEKKLLSYKIGKP